jgi:hypothetical protein
LALLEGFADTANKQPQPRLAESWPGLLSRSEYMADAPNPADANKEFYPIGAVNLIASSEAEVETKGNDNGSKIIEVDVSQGNSGTPDRTS